MTASNDIYTILYRVLIFYRYKLLQVIGIHKLNLFSRIPKITKIFSLRVITSSCVFIETPKHYIETLNPPHICCVVDSRFQCSVSVFQFNASKFTCVHVEWMWYSLALWSSITSGVFSLGGSVYFVYLLICWYVCLSVIVYLFC